MATQLHSNSQFGFVKSPLRKGRSSGARHASSEGRKGRIIASREMRKRERERDTDGPTDRQTDRQTDRRNHRQKGRERRASGRIRWRGQRDRETNRQRETDRKTRRQTVKRAEKDALLIVVVGVDVVPDERTATQNERQFFDRIHRDHGGDHLVPRPHHLHRRVQLL